MRMLVAYSTSKFQPPKRRKRNPHADVDLLTHMACLIAVNHFAANGEPLSRNACFGIAWDYLSDELWPLTTNVPAHLRKRTVFLGIGEGVRGSWRRWVGDVQGMIAAERLSDAACQRRGNSRDSVAKAVRAKAAFEVFWRKLKCGKTTYMMSTTVVR